MDLGKDCVAWQQAIIHPYKFFSKFKAKPDLMTAAKWAAIGGVISLLLNDIVLAYYGQAEVVSSIIGVIIAGIIIVPIMVMISSGIVLMFAKLLGGKGDYKAQTYALAFVQVPIMVANAAFEFVFNLLVKPSSFTFSSPVHTGSAELIFRILNLVILIYGFYLTVLVLRNVHKYSTMRAIATLLIPGVLLVILIVLVVLFFTVSGFSTAAA